MEGVQLDGCRALVVARRAGGLAGTDLILDQVKDVLAVDALGIPVAGERVATPAFAVAVDRACVAAPVAEHAAVPGAALDRVLLEVEGELHQAIVCELPELGA